MNDLTHSGPGGGSPARMTSREIADLLNVRHDSVRRTIERLADKGVVQLPPLVEVRNHLGQSVSEYVFSGEVGKRDSYIVVAQLSPEFTARLVDRWQDLEARPVMDPVAALNDPATMRRLLLTYSERVMALENKVQDDAPKVAFADQVTVSAGSITIAQAAKILGTGRNRLMARLREWHWVTRLGEPYQEKINSGLLDVKIGSWEHPEKGLQRSVTALVTGKGLRKLWGLFFPDTDPTYSLNCTQNGAEIRPSAPPLTLNGSTPVMASNALSTPAPIQQLTLRAWIVCKCLPDGCIAYPVADYDNAPHLRPGDIAVVDPEDCEPQNGELFVIEWMGGTKDIVETWSKPMRLGCGTDNEFINTVGWLVGASARARSADEVVARMKGGRFVGWVNGPYATEGPNAGALSRKLRGKVVGILEPNYDEPRRPALPSS